MFGQRHWKVRDLSYCLWQVETTWYFVIKTNRQKGGWVFALHLVISQSQMLLSNVNYNTLNAGITPWSNLRLSVLLKGTVLGSEFEPRIVKFGLCGSEKVPGLSTGWARTSFSIKFTSSLLVDLGFLQVFWVPNMQDRWIGDTKIVCWTSGEWMDGSLS